MLTIRREQFEALRSVARQAFEENQAKWARAHHAKRYEETDDAELRSLVRSLVQLGDRHDVFFKRDVIRLVRLGLALGDGDALLELPGARELLQDTGLGGAEKVGRLEALAENNWST